MKNILIVVAVLLLPLSGYSQKGVKSFYNKYKKYENVTSVKLQGWVIKLAAKFADDPDAKKAARHISKLRVLTMENGNLVTKEDYKSLIRSIRKDQFEDLIMVREGTTKINLYIKEKKDKITNALLIVNDVDEFVMISLEGKLRLKDLEELDITVEGGDYFNKLPKNKKATQKKKDTDNVPRA